MTNYFHLPQVNLTYDYHEVDFKTLLYYTSDIDKQSYQQFQKIIQDFVGADCWALTVDDNIVFNSFPENENDIRTEITDDLIRDKIIENPHGSLLVHLIRRNRNARIRIYMFCSYSWTMNIDYKASHKVFQISFSQSQELKEYNQNRMS